MTTSETKSFGVYEFQLLSLTESIYLLNTVPHPTEVFLFPFFDDDNKVFFRVGKFGDLNFNFFNDIFFLRLRSILSRGHSDNAHVQERFKSSRYLYSLKKCY